MSWPLWKAVLWCRGPVIALAEYYCLAVPQRTGWGMGNFPGFQLKAVQEVVTLCVFMVFAVAFLKENGWRGNYLVSRSGWDCRRGLFAFGVKSAAS